MKNVNRRSMLFRAMALGAVSTLPGCDYEDPAHPDIADKFLHAMSAWNDRVQEALFDPHTLAPTFRADQITNPPRFNAFYDISQVPVVDPATYQLELGGQIQDKSPWTLAALNALAQTSQITRLTCVEGWRVIGEWEGVPLGDFLRRIGADTTCRYVSFKCADGYYSSIDMPSALHPQTILALKFLGAPLTPPFGAPVRLRIPTKLGFKNPKSIMQLAVTNIYPGGYWEDQGYNWFSGS
ncbi:oxidoreductase molybdopterin-binding protein [Acidocella aquatica]|uniref:Oxidoreductase molybdopterin-binding protein n=1 Tax=Acidocella aquatica TaxID=1922313 RepID=A0ABQ6AE64_9PROT|nr:molybdopterin-dependent oxidoreductase [Acidocella aquatica]GLR68508.1 oxidoreductase molybdopterin-binding protein [Acidocella aquatica]